MYIECIKCVNTQKGYIMISIDYQDKRPLYEQVVEKIETLIVNGILPKDEKLPSVRNLAIELSINPNTIQRAYTVLEQSGFIYTVKGRGNFVSNRDNWIGNEKSDMMSALKSDIKKAISLGITRKEVETVIEQIYEEGNK